MEARIYAYIAISHVERRRHLREKLRRMPSPLRRLFAKTSLKIRAKVSQGAEDQLNPPNGTPLCCAISKAR